jgi:hypothetical protein
MILAGVLSVILTLIIIGLIISIVRSPSMRSDRQGGASASDVRDDIAGLHADLDNLESDLKDRGMLAANIPSRQYLHKPHTRNTRLMSVQEPASAPVSGLPFAQTASEAFTSPIFAHHLQSRATAAPIDSRTMNPVTIKSSTNHLRDVPLHSMTQETAPPAPPVGNPSAHEWDKDFSFQSNDVRSTYRHPSIPLDSIRDIDGSTKAHKSARMPGVAPPTYDDYTRDMQRHQDAIISSLPVGLENTRAFGAAPPTSAVADILTQDEDKVLLASTLRYYQRLQEAGASIPTHMAEALQAHIYRDKGTVLDSIASLPT